MALVTYGAIKARAAQIFADIKKSHEQMEDGPAKENDPAKDMTVDKVVLMLVHNLREHNVEINFSSSATDDLNFANGKPDFARTQVLPHNATL